MYQDVVRLETRPGDIVDITGDVQRAVTESGIVHGLCIVTSQGSTCSIFVNENDTMLLTDIKKFLAKLVPERHVYHHPENAHSHIKAAFLGNGVTLPVRDRLLQLGKWQSLLAAEFDTKPRKREFIVSVY